MKRKHAPPATALPCKRPTLPPRAPAAPPGPGPDHPVLRRLYPQVLTLRHYLLSRLPTSSKGRRRRIAHVGSAPRAQDDDACTRDLDLQLGTLLDSALVACFPNPEPKHTEHDARERERESFTQQRSQTVSGGTFKPGYFLQSEIVDFVIWLLFRRSTAHKPSHLLCHGFLRAAHTDRAYPQHHGAPRSSIPGLVERAPNSHVRALKEPTWCRLQTLLGQGGDRVMIDMLLDCAIFLPVNGGAGNYYQLSGDPVSDVKPDQTPQHQPLHDEANQPAKRVPLNQHSENRAPGAIAFVRSRMLYAKAALNAKGRVRFGLRHIHILNRLTKRDDQLETIQILRYIFPRQFKLHNVFTSKVDRRETSMPFNDYTLREKEIYQTMCRALNDNATDAQLVRRWRSRVPKRLRGAPLALIDRLRTLHHRCSYTELLRYYCPSSNDSTLDPNTAEHPCVTDMACHTADVSAFCRAVVAKVIPNAFWGRDSNRRTIMYWIDQFISLRRFESLNLHQVTQKLEITGVTWLQQPGENPSAKLAKSDLDKRKELFLEFIYWVFDSFLIPLIRSNFHVTESSVHKNRLFYFRHDVWRMLTEPSLTRLKANMFEPMPSERMARLLSMRPLGFSKIRLLPKRDGFRTIMNLKRRQQVVKNGVTSLGRSINAVMTPVFNVITYERASAGPRMKLSLQPDVFGCSLFSVTDMLPKLAAFQLSLKQRNLAHSRLFFAKVDVQQCFDTIPQQRLLTMVEGLMSLPVYQTGKHVEISPLGALQRLDGQHLDPPPVKRYVAHSGAAKDMSSFQQVIERNFVGIKSDTIFVNTNLQQQETKDDLMRLLREHIERNLVKIGKKFYRQKRGIPQGSVLSSILCNFFYAELERDVLSFALGDDCLLLRLLDDFLLITVQQQYAERFLRVMHQGHADYGVTVNPSKSLANFEATTEAGQSIPRTTETQFPYCGVCIDTVTLEVKKRGERCARMDVEDSLTVELSKMPGQTFHRKALNAFKIQLKAMYLDASLNSVSTILGNLYQSFEEAAVRCLEYVRVLSRVRTTCSSVLIKTIDGMIALAFVMLQRPCRSRSSRPQCAIQNVISRRQLQW
ncbi:Telomerase reverse transcriptase [Pleosporales sp. CAS-2024a]